MPGELFVEYQLAAQKFRPDLFVAMAAYGDYAPGYIGTEIAYPQGGYETGPRASLVAPRDVERILIDVMQDGCSYRQLEHDHPVLEERHHGPARLVVLSCFPFSSGRDDDGDFYRRPVRQLEADLIVVKSALLGWLRHRRLRAV